MNPPTNAKGPTLRAEMVANCQVAAPIPNSRVLARHMYALVDA